MISSSLKKQHRQYRQSQDGGNDGYDLVSRLPSDFDDYGDSSRGANGLLLAGAGSVSENGSQLDLGERQNWTASHTHQSFVSHDGNHDWSMINNLDFQPSMLQSSPGLLTALEEDSMFQPLEPEPHERQSGLPQQQYHYQSSQSEQLHHHHHQQDGPSDGSLFQDQGGGGFGKLDYMDTFGSGRLFSYSMNDM